MTQENQSPDLLAALKKAEFAIESVIMLQGLTVLSPTLDEIKTAIKAAERR